MSTFMGDSLECFSLLIRFSSFLFLGWRFSSFACISAEVFLWAVLTRVFCVFFGFFFILWVLASWGWGVCGFSLFIIFLFGGGCVLCLFVVVFGFGFGCFGVFFFFFWWVGVLCFFFLGGGGFLAFWLWWLLWLVFGLVVFFWRVGFFFFGVGMVGFWLSGLVARFALGTSLAFAGLPLVPGSRPTAGFCFY